MSIVRIGSTKKFSENWGNIFGGKKAAPVVKRSGNKKKATAKAAKSAKK